MQTPDYGGLSIREVNNKMDLMFLEIDQLENKVTRRVEDQIDFHCSECRIPMLASAKQLMIVEQAVWRLKKPKAGSQNAEWKAGRISAWKKKAVFPV